MEPLPGFHLPALSAAPRPNRAERRARAPRHRKPTPTPQPWIFDLPTPDAPLPYQPTAPTLGRTRYPLRDRDPFGEWINPHQCPEILAALERLPPDYTASVAYIRGQRPRDAGPALQFWAAPVARAHFLNALLLRAHRTAVQVHEDLDVTPEKSYAYLPRWGVEFRPRRRDVLLEDAAGDRYPATVETWHAATGTAQLRVNGYNLTVTARHVGHQRDQLSADPETGTGADDSLQSVYRTADTVAAHPDRLLSLTVMERLTGLSTHGLRQLFQPALRATRGELLVPLHDFEAVVPRARWRMTLADAQRRANPCACAFWDLHAGRCGLDQPTPNQPRDCEDWSAL